MARGLVARMPGFEVMYVCTRSSKDGKAGEDWEGETPAGDFFCRCRISGFFMLDICFFDGPPRRHVVQVPITNGL